MNEFLRPATLGEILDRTASLYRSRFLALFGIASVPAAVFLGFMGSIVLLFAAVGKSGPQANAVAMIFGGLLFLLVLPLLVGAQSLTGAALCHAAGELIGGEKPNIRGSFRAVWHRGWSYVGLYLLLVLILFGVPMLIWTIFFGAVGVASIAAGPSAAGALVGAFTLLLILVLTVYAFWMLTRLCLAFPIAVLEQASVTVAIKRAASLSRGRRWRILVLFLLGVALSWVTSLIVMVPLFTVLALVPSLNTPQHAEMIGTIAIAGVYGAWFVVQALTVPVYAIALVLFYYDQRVRKEGLDIEMLMRQAGMMIETAAVPASTEVEPRIEPTGAEPTTAEAAAVAVHENPA